MSPGYGEGKVCVLKSMRGRRQLTVLADHARAHLADHTLAVGGEGNVGGTGLV
jgi:hypothetical protein